LRFEFCEPVKQSEVTTVSASNPLSVSKRFVPVESSEDEFASDSDDDEDMMEPRSGGSSHKKEVALSQSAMWDLEAFL
jgi:hypothetical protein